MQGGGHSILSPNFGLGMDRVVSKPDYLKSFPTDLNYVMCRLNSKLSHRMVNIEWQMNAKMRIFSGPFVAVVLEHGALCLRALTRLNHSLNCKCR